MFNASKQISVATKKSNLRNSSALTNQNSTNSQIQQRKGSVGPNPVLNTENSFQQTKESNLSNITKNSLYFGRNNPESTTKNNIVRVASKSPNKSSNFQPEKKVSLPNTAPIKKQVPKKTSMPLSHQQSLMNKSKNDDIDIIPFGEDNTGKVDFKSKIGVKRNSQEDFVTGLINDGYVE